MPPIPAANENAKDMEYLGQHFSHQLFRNSEGYIEGYRSIGLLENQLSYCRQAKDCIRIVTRAKTVEEFGEWIETKSKKPKKRKSVIPPEQLKLELD